MSISSMLCDFLNLDLVALIMGDRRSELLLITTVTLLPPLTLSWSFLFCSPWLLWYVQLPGKGPALCSILGAENKGGSGSFILIWAQKMSCTRAVLEKTKTGQRLLFKFWFGGKLRHFRSNCGTAGTPLSYLESRSLRSGLGLEVGVRSSLEGKAVRSSSGLGVLVQFCQGFWEGGPEDCGSLSGVERWLLWKGSVWVSSSRGTPTIRSCLRRGRRPCVDWLRGLEPSGGFPWLPVEDGGSRGDSSASKPVLS